MTRMDMYMYACIYYWLVVCKHRREELVKQINQALEEADVLITTGGVSMGEKVQAWYRVLILIDLDLHVFV